MVGAIGRELLSRESIDQVAVSIETQAEPAGVGSEIGERHQDAEAVGVGQGVDGSGGEGRASRSPVALLAKAPPGFELYPNGLGEIGEGGRGPTWRSADRQGAFSGHAGISTPIGRFDGLPAAPGWRWRCVLVCGCLRDPA
jgi:hypothetical protein